MEETPERGLSAACRRAGVRIGAPLRRLVGRTRRLAISDARRAHPPAPASFLSEALDHAALDNLSFDGLDLRGRDLSGSSIRWATFDGADLADASLRDADLTGARLGGAIGLLGGQLGGAVLEGASLPEEIARFPGVRYVEDLSKNAGKMLTTMLALVAFAMLTVAGTADREFFAKGTGIRLPFFETTVPTTWFYALGPMLLAASYLYLHLYLLRLWEALAKLPAVFPDGRRVDEATYPWLLSDLAMPHIRRLADRRPPLSGLQQRLYSFLVWWLVPTAILVFWVRYQVVRAPTSEEDPVVHATAVAALQTATMVGVLFAGIRLRAVFRSVMRRPQSRERLSLRRLGGFVAQAAAAFAVGRLMLVASEGARSPFAEVDLRDVRFSVAPAGWDPKSVSMAGVDGADLSYASMSGVDASRAFLANADLDHSDWSGSRLDRADLRRAQMEGARLPNTWFMSTDLRRAMLPGADLRSAWMAEADLRGASLRGANLTEAYLGGARLEAANLDAAEMPKATLRRAELAGASLRKANLQKADVTGADLNKANLAGARLEGAIYDKATRWPSGFDPKGAGAVLRRHSRS